jgi:hypothetical protein
MQIVITAKVMHHDRLGRLPRGSIADIPDHQATDWLRRGFAERYETKVMRDRPLMAAGAPLSALPVAQALPQTTLKPSGRGGKRRRTEASSSPTPPTA